MLLSSDANGVASLSLSRTSIYITDENSVTGLVFPVDPIVVSLRDYDSAKSANEPTNGYPLICVTVSYITYYAMCDNDNTTLFCRTRSGYLADIVRHIPSALQFYSKPVVKSVAD